MKKLTQSLWIISILTGAILMKRVVERQQIHKLNGSKGGKARKNSLEEYNLEKTLDRHHINDV